LSLQAQKEPFADTRLWVAADTPDPYRTEEIVMSGQIIKVGQMEIRYLVDGAQTGGLGLFEMKVPAGAHVPPPHSHTNQEECVYVLEGVLRYSVDDETRDLKPGDWMSTPRGSVHHFSNPGSETARTLVMLTPDTGVQFFRDVAALASAGGPPDRAKLMEVMGRYGLVPAAPKQAPRVANG
jgi:quercetin dioxygenase-like cupin family protein